MPSAFCSRGVDARFVGGAALALQRSINNEALTKSRHCCAPLTSVVRGFLLLPMQMRGVGCGLNSDWVANEKSIYSGLFGAPGFEPCGLWVVRPRKRQGSHNRQGQGAGTGSNERLARPELSWRLTRSGRSAPCRRGCFESGGQLQFCPAGPMAFIRCPCSN